MNCILYLQQAGDDDATNPFPKPEHQMTVRRLANGLASFHRLWSTHSHPRLAIPYWRNRWRNALCVTRSPEGTKEGKVNPHSILAAKDLRLSQISLQRQAKRQGVKSRRMSHFLLLSNMDGKCWGTGYWGPTCQCGDQLNWFDATAGRRVVLHFSRPCAGCHCVVISTVFYPNL